MPTSELVFHSGKAMARPTSRIANTVSVLATAHSMPASTANGISCRLAPRSRKHRARSFEKRGHAPARDEDAGHHAQRDRVRRQAGIHQLGWRLRRAQPHARANAAEHAQSVTRRNAAGPARSQAVCSSACPFLSRESGLSSVHGNQQRHAKQKHCERNEEVTVSEDSARLHLCSGTGNLRNHKDAASHVSTGCAEACLIVGPPRRSHARNALQIGREFDALKSLRQQQCTDRVPLVVANLQHDESARNKHIARLPNQAAID